MPAISESNRPVADGNVQDNEDDEDMSSFGENHEIDDILDEAMDDEDEDTEPLHNYSRSPKRMVASGAATHHSPTSSAASWEFQTPTTNPPKVSQSCSDGSLFGILKINYHFFLPLLEQQWP